MQVHQWTATAARSNLPLSYHITALLRLRLRGRHNGRSGLPNSSRLSPVHVWWFSQATHSRAANVCPVNYQLSGSWCWTEAPWQPKNSCCRRLHRRWRDSLAGRVSILVNRQKLRTVHLDAMVRTQMSRWYRFDGSCVY